VEDDDVGRPDTGAEGLQRALVRFVGRLPRDGEALIPALRDLPGGEGAEEREDDLGADHLPAVTSDDVCEASQHPSPFELLPFEATHGWRLRGAADLIAG
jgi:hypothetical protein